MQHFEVFFSLEYSTIANSDPMYELIKIRVIFFGFVVQAIVEAWLIIIRSCQGLEVKFEISCDDSGKG